MIIYINGCSHSIGVSKEYSWARVVLNSLCRDGKYIHINRDKINLTNNSNILYNDSDSAKGNDMIYIQTLEFLSQCRNEGIKPDYIIIQWSGPSRIARQDVFENMIFHTPSDEENNIILEPHGSRLTLSYMISLQEILKSMNIEYFFINYMELDTKIEKYNILNSLDVSRCISFNESTHPLFDGWRISIRKNGLSMDSDGHPSYLGHYFIANRILKYMNVDNSDVGFFELLKDKKLKYVNYYKDKYLSKEVTIENAKELGSSSVHVKKSFIKRFII